MTRDDRRDTAATPRSRRPRRQGGRSAHAASSAALQPRPYWVHGYPGSVDRDRLRPRPDHGTDDGGADLFPPSLGVTVIGPDRISGRGTFGAGSVLVSGAGAITLRGPGTVRGCGAGTDPTPDAGTDTTAYATADTVAVAGTDADGVTDPIANADAEAA